MEDHGFFYYKKDRQEGMMPNLMEGLQKEMNRCRELVKLYEEIPTGGFGATMIKQDISNAEKAIAGGDIVEMLKIFKVLQECE